MRHGSLFSGIGGFDLAAEWMGWENVFHCEWNTFGQRILNYYWPKAIQYHDITKTDFTIHRGSIDILTGGFPCQPYSMAGKRLGKEDERHLWPHMLRAIQEIRPRWVVGENVFGLVNWNGGLVFEEVQADLEAQGYEVQPYVLPAASVNAPHRRDRVWFVAYAASNGHADRCEETQSKIGSCEQRRVQQSQGVGGQWYASHAETDRIHETKPVIKHSDCIGQKRRLHENKPEITIREQFDKRDACCHGTAAWQNFPTQPPICSGDDGLPTRLDNITFSKWRNESIKGYGNAIVPQVVYQIFKAINQYELHNSR